MTYPTKKHALLISVFAIGLAITASVMAKSTPEEDAIEYRQSGFKMVKYHIGPLGAMMKGKMDFDADVFKKNADALAALSQLVGNGFIDGSYEGDTRAKKDIADNMDDFNEKLETFKVEAANLAKAAEGASDLDSLKAPFGKVGQSCKACHKAYRNKK